ncbi:response regulator [Variovorax sp. LT1P1]|uniref:response regulator n=1 Tax=Variovorax sp. LT1P1 TaxID=3443730 RepID=UPI003F4893B4
MPLKTYLVEDNQVIVANLTETLQELADVVMVGYVAEAQTASQWLRTHTNDWDLVIVDLFLRQGSGLEVLAALRDRATRQRVIVASNYATPEMRSQCKALGADRVFDKSTEIDALVSYCLAAA